jgi:hypothetical protein
MQSCRKIKYLTLPHSYFLDLVTLNYCRMKIPKNKYLPVLLSTINIKGIVFPDKAQQEIIKADSTWLHFYDHYLAQLLSIFINVFILKYLKTGPQTYGISPSLSSSSETTADSEAQK